MLIDEPTREYLRRAGLYVDIAADDPTRAEAGTNEAISVGTDDGSEPSALRALAAHLRYLAERCERAAASATATW